METTELQEGELIWVLRRKLSDGSFVYDVDVFGTIVPAITQLHAEKMAEAIAEAISENSTATVEVMYA